MKILTKYHNLATKFPNIAKEFHSTKNIDKYGKILTPFDVTPKSGYKAWWTCQICYQDYQAKISNRTICNSGCPFCSGKKVSSKYNLLTKFPEIASQWHPTLNGDLKTDQVLPSSAINYWWSCEFDHTYKTSINARTSNNHGCPYCSGRLASPENNLAVKFPHLLEEWDWEFNGELLPTQLTPRSGKRVRWKCKKEHRWMDSPHNRSKISGSKCIQCYLLENSLAIKYPKLLNEWDYTKNSILPEQITCGSDKKVWWICPYKHNYLTSIANRVQGRGCSFCAGKKINNTNNLVYLRPDLAKEWHSTLNGDKKPEDFTTGSHEQIWWQCLNYVDHIWESSIYNRVRGNSCPSCAGVNTRLEKFVQHKLNIPKFNKKILINHSYQPDFKLSDNLYLNVDGLYWHSNLKRPKNYHYKLREAFESEGKRILQFYEDEVYNKWSIVESIINNSLGKITTKLDARKCNIVGVKPHVAKEFLQQNHLMGFYFSAKHFGLIHNNELVTLISVRKIKDTIEISRFCNKINTNVRGSFSRLLKHVIKLYTPSKVISFCDLRYATGVSYTKNRFKLVGITQGWQWTDFKQRYNRLMCKSTKSQTEKEKANKLGWYKIYDAGQAKYECLK
jgi:hypothetical protein